MTYPLKANSNIILIMIIVPSYLTVHYWEIGIILNLLILLLNFLVGNFLLTSVTIHSEKIEIKKTFWKYTIKNKYTILPSDIRKMEFMGMQLSSMSVRIKRKKKESIVLFDNQNKHRQLYDDLINFCEVNDVSFSKSKEYELMDKKYRLKQASEEYEKKRARKFDNLQVKSKL